MQTPDYVYSVMQVLCYNKAEAKVFRQQSETNSPLPQRNSPLPQVSNKLAER